MLIKLRTHDGKHILDNHSPKIIEGEIYRRRISQIKHSPEVTLVDIRPSDGSPWVTAFVDANNVHS